MLKAFWVWHQRSRRCDTKWSNPRWIQHLMIPKIAGWYIYHHIPVSHCFSKTADNCFYIASDSTKVLVISSRSETFTVILCSKIGRAMGTECLFPPPRGFEVLSQPIFLSVFKCCLALLILSGKLEHKSSESSFILMSQVLDLLKSEYWNGLELATFKGAPHPLCLWCRSGLGKWVPPPLHRPDASLALSHPFFFFLTSESGTLPDKSFMLMQAVWRSVDVGNDKRPGFIQQTSHTGSM